MKTLITLISLIFVQQASAVLVENRLNLDIDVWQEEIVVTCQGQDSRICQDLCNDRSQCIAPQNSCRNCIGTTSSILRSVFTDFSQTWLRQAGALTANQLTRILASENTVLIGPKSIYNFYTSINDPSVAAKFNEVCGVDSSRIPPLVVVETGETFVPEKVSHILCPSSQGMTAFQLDNRTAVEASSANPAALH